MRKLFRVIYPFVVYMIIAEIMMLMPIAIIPEEGIYRMSAAAVLTCLLLWPLYRQDLVMGRKVQNGGSEDKGWIKGLFFAILLGAGICVAGNNFISLIRLDTFFPGYGEVVAETLFEGSLSLQLLCVGLLIPAAEEMVFRILGFRRMRDYMEFVPAALITSFLFGFYHGNVMQGVYGFLLALFIAYAYEMYDKPFIPIAIHASANAVSVILTAFEGSRGAGRTLVLIKTILAAVLIILSLKKIRFYGLTNR